MQINNSQISKQAHLQGQSVVNNSRETRGELLLHDGSVHNFSTAKWEKEKECSWRTVDILVHTSDFHKENSNITLQFTHNSSQINSGGLVDLWSVKIASSPNILTSRCEAIASNQVRVWMCPNGSINNTVV